MMQCRFLFVHCYPVHLVEGRYVLDLLARAVGRKAARIQDQYEKILIAGGWDDHNLPPEETLGKHMRDYLISLGVPQRKIILWTDWKELRERQPPRDSLEEICLLGMMLEVLAKKGIIAGRVKHIPFDAICSAAHLPRLALHYRQFGANCRRVIPVWHFRIQNPKTILLQLAAVALAWRHPQTFGAICQKIREKRTIRTATAPLPLPQKWSDF